MSYLPCIWSVPAKEDIVNIPKSIDNDSVTHIRVKLHDDFVAKISVIFKSLGLRAITPPASPINNLVTSLKIRNASFLYSLFVLVTFHPFN